MPNQRLALAFLLLVLTGCADNDNSGPATVSQTSASTPKLSDRIRFVESYVNFRREYNELEYNIVYHNNSSRLSAPGPSDWNIILIAKVPPDQIEQWVLPKTLDEGVPKPVWHKEAAREIDVSSVDEWYTDGNRTIGLDRARSIIVYRNTTL